MLIKNKCTIRISATIDLFFDDGDEKHIELNNNDNINITYRYNGRKRTINGKIKNIEVIKTKYSDYIAVLYVDYSEDFNSMIARIYSNDIIDVTINEETDNINCY